MFVAVTAVVFFTFQAAGNLSRGRTFWLAVGILFVLLALATGVREARMFWRAKRSPTA
jgi:hypothetical protein